MTMTVSLTVGDEVVETLTVNETVASPDRGVATAIKFISKENAPKLYHAANNDYGDGRRHRLSPIEIAHHSTGVDRSTGRRSLGVGMSNRRGLVRFDADLWKLDRDLASGAQAFLADLWRQQNAGTPAYLLKRMERYFGPTHFQFDALPEQVKDWQAFLTEVLSGVDGYSPIYWKVSRAQ